MTQNEIRLNIVDKMNQSSFTLTNEEISYIVARYLEQHTQKRVSDLSLKYDMISVTMDNSSILKNH
jgi:hypothetical protein